MLTAQEIYIAARALSLPERLRLAALILDELHESPFSQIEPASLAGYSDSWTEEDLRDFRQFSASHLGLGETLLETEQDAALPSLEDLLTLKREQSLEPGDLVVVDFPGAVAAKRRPAVVVSSRTYHSERPDLIVGLVTSQIPSVQSTSDWLAHPIGFCWTGRVPD